MTEVRAAPPVVANPDLQETIMGGLKDRIEALGGRISLHSLPGAGVTLDIALPLSGPAGRHGKAESSGRT
jgi:hypothetical protein